MTPSAKGWEQIHNELAPGLWFESPGLAILSLMDLPSMDIYAFHEGSCNMMEGSWTRHAGPQESL